MPVILKIISNTPLHIVISEGHTEVAKIPLEMSNIDIDARDQYRYTPLHVSEKCGHVDVVKALVGVANTNMNVSNSND